MLDNLNLHTFCHCISCKFFGNVNMFHIFAKVVAKVGTKIRRMRKMKFPFRHCVQCMRQGLRASCSLRRYIFCGEDIKQESQYLTLFLQKNESCSTCPRLPATTPSTEDTTQCSSGKHRFYIFKSLVFWIFWLAWLFWSLLSCLYRPFMIFERCLDSNPAQGGARPT